MLYISFFTFDAKELIVNAFSFIDAVFPVRLPASSSAGAPGRRDVSAGEEVDQKIF